LRRLFVFAQPSLLGHHPSMLLRSLCLCVALVLIGLAASEAASKKNAPTRDFLVMGGGAGEHM
jgi:hypothetical protein